MANRPQLMGSIQEIRIALCVRTVLSRGILAIYHTPSVLSLKIYFTAHWAQTSIQHLFQVGST